MKLQIGPTIIKNNLNQLLLVLLLQPIDFLKTNHALRLKSSALKLPTNEKGNKPLDKSSSSNSSKSTSIHSKESTKELQGDSIKTISHVDMFPEISQY
jgi:hypothetical protein